MKYDNPILNERQSSHGDFSNTADAAQKIKGVLRHTAQTSGVRLTPVQWEAVDLIATKLARVVSGNPNELEHWKDIAGYADLSSAQLIPAEVKSIFTERADVKQST